jgi:lysylphosphatidylglycerol synthetase-like protein (DUF2156 family)
MHVLSFRDRVIHRVNVTTDQWLNTHSNDNSSFNIDAEPGEYLEMLKIELDREFLP